MHNTVIYNLDRNNNHQVRILYHILYTYNQLAFDIQQNILATRDCTTCMIPLSIRLLSSQFSQWLQIMFDE